MAYRVTGMTCEHCVRAVIGEVGGLDGVSAVTVDLVADHLRHCVASAVRTSEADGERAVEELTGTIRQVIRL